ncbi:DUF5686 and carboxypeptidase regulatory-like domain-containing protein [uncultured Polaribacter sp.]|uniref:DUF5686 and carboxypeptidase regulatory-like domain-containing protein n=1 Tax=uncultured Polaribacter sp. TaxID=174711 RepID=UPI00261A1582|nr:DUF5686 and carboxypeptidase regulatory-like domain-containing protein [uncultured Polaribacter sp.]
MKKTTLLFFLFIASMQIAQVKGKITDTKNEPLPFVSVYLDKSVTGTTSNDNGAYVLKLNKLGKHTVVFQFLGFKTLKKEINITAFPFELNVTLEEESVSLNTITVSTKENPANAIIRKVLENKEKNTDKFANYTARFYSRGLTRIKDAPEKFFGQSTGDLGGGLDSTRSGIIYLSETFSNISFQKKPQNFKEKIIASKVSGEDNGISFNRAEDSNINLYNNSIAVFNDLVSPISSNAFGYYKYNLEGTFYDKNKRLINKIKLIPKRKNDRVFTGFIYIVEEDWALYGCDLTTNGSQVNIPIVNELKLKQGYNYAEEIDAWVLISQTIDFDISLFGFKPTGKFSYAYSDYNFKPNFTKKTFTNEVLSFAQNATKKDTVFWNKLRPVPLTEEEVADYRLKDSIKVIRKSKKYLDSIDAKNNKFGIFDPFTGYTYKNSYKNKSFSYSGPLSRTGYNTVQGINTSLGFSYFNEINEQGKWWNVGVDFDYGFSEKKLRPTFYFVKKWDNFSRPRLTLYGGVTTEQFNGREPILKLNNTITSFFYGDNYMKIYEKSFASVRYSEQVRNGIYFSGSLEYAKRTPLFNTTDYSLARGENKNFTSNNPLDPTDFTIGAFTEHTIATLNLQATFVIGQKYLTYPDRKVNDGGSKYPTMSLNYIKRFGAENNNLNSDLFIANIRQNLEAGNYGSFQYHMRAGAFLKQKDIAFMDKLQVNGNQLLFPIDRQLNSFNLLEYYRFYTNDRYAEMHVEHNFKGSVLGKIPLLNKLNFHLIVGGKGLLMADNNPYTEYSVGLANLGFGKWRFLRMEFVNARYGAVKEMGFVFRLNL